MLLACWRRTWRDPYLCGIMLMSLNLGQKYFLVADYILFCQAIWIIVTGSYFPVTCNISDDQTTDNNSSDCHSRSFDSRVMWQQGRVTTCLETEECCDSKGLWQLSFLTAQFYFSDNKDVKCWDNSDVLPFFPQFVPIIRDHSLPP